MAVVVDSNNVRKDLQYEPPLVIAWGVDEHTAGSKTITMGRTIIPPAGRNQRHYHACDATFYMAKGSITVWVGEEKAEHVLTQGQFCFVPAGEIHGIMNRSDRDTAELIFTYGNCPSRDAAKTIYVEKAWV